MRERPKGRERLKEAIRGALAASVMMTMPLETDAAPRDKHAITQSISKETPALKALRLEWEKAKIEEKDKGELDRSKAWLTINAAFENAITPKEKLDIVRYFGTRKNIGEGTFAAQFAVRDWEMWKMGGPDAAVIMQKLLEYEPYDAIMEANAFSSEPWAAEIINKAGKRFPEAAIAHFGDYKSVPGAIELLKMFITSVGASRAFSISFLESTNLLADKEKQNLRSTLPSNAHIDFEVALSTQSDHFEESSIFRKEVDMFPAVTFPFDLLKPIAELPALESADLAAYRDYFENRSRHMTEYPDHRNRLIERKMEALQRLSRLGQHPVEMSMNAMIVMRRLTQEKRPFNAENIAQEVAAIKSERDRSRKIDMFGGDTLLVTHGEIAQYDRYEHHKKGTPFFSSEEQVRTLRGLVESKGYRFEHLTPAEKINGHYSSDGPPRAEKIKRTVLAWITQPHKGPIRLRFLGHGGPEGFFLSEGENVGDKIVHASASSRYIGVDELFVAIRKRAASDADTSQDIFVLDGCYQYDFIERELDKLARENIPPPVFVSAAGKGLTTLIYPTTPFGSDVSKEISLAPKLGDLYHLIKPGLRSQPSVFGPTNERGKWRGKQLSGTFETMAA